MLVRENCTEGLILEWSHEGICLKDQTGMPCRQSRTQAPAVNTPQLPKILALMARQQCFMCFLRIVSPNPHSASVEKALSFTDVGTNA